MEKTLKAMWEVEITRRESIKPATQTPPHLRTHKLSWLDLLIHRDHVSFVLFYPKPNNPNFLSALRTSLSQTLAIFYPLAGRLNPDGTSVDCNDEGVSFFEARAIAHAPLSHLVSDPDAVDSINSLLPCTQHCLRKCSDGPLLCVQVTTFSPCGGIAIGCCLSHNIADGHSAATFIDTWAASARDSTTIHKTPVLFEAASYFAPPSDDKSRDELMALKWVPPQEQEQASPVTKMFFFRDSPSILNLKESSSVPGLTRVQAVTALIWRCCMRSKKEITTGGTKSGSSAIALIAANMRGKGRGLPDNLFGNLGFMVAAWDRVDDKLRSEERVNAAIRSIDEEKVTRYQERGGWSLILESVSDAVKRVEEETGGGPEDMYFFSSWTRFGPLYEADFGWGRPVWMAPGGPFMRCEFVLTARSGGGEGGGGGGIEAWVTLEEEEMMRFESDEEIKMYASSR